MQFTPPPPGGCGNPATAVTGSPPSKWVGLPLPAEPDFFHCPFTEVACLAGHLEARTFRKNMTQLEHGGAQPLLKDRSIVLGQWSLQGQTSPARFVRLEGAAGFLGLCRKSNDSRPFKILTRFPAHMLWVVYTSGRANRPEFLEFDLAWRRKRRNGIQSHGV